MDILLRIIKYRFVLWYTYVYQNEVKHKCREVINDIVE
jgi:hypothetical protein